MELPVGATEDRVVGTLDLTAAFTGGELRFSPGLLAAADGGVLYVDEINLLPDHLVDVLLDAAASGINRVEREGVSHAHASRFLLIGSMNPEEGDLRPQLLDRFGLAVEVRSGDDPAERAAAVRRRLAFDEDPAPVVAAVGRRRGGAGPAAARRRRPARLPDGLVEAVSSLCVAVGAEGLRADLTICRAAAALAGWEGRAEAGPDDVRRVAPLALAHRARRDPLEPAGMDRQRLEDALSEHLGPPETSRRSRRRIGDRRLSGEPVPGVNDPPSRPTRPARPATARGRPPPALLPRWHAGSRGGGPLTPKVRRGRLVGDRAPGGPLASVASVAVGATARRAAARIAASGGRRVRGGRPPSSAEDLAGGPAGRTARPA